MYVSLVNPTTTYESCTFWGNFIIVIIFDNSLQLWWITISSTFLSHLAKWPRPYNCWQQWYHPCNHWQFSSFLYFWSAAHFLHTLPNGPIQGRPCNCWQWWYHPCYRWQFSSFLYFWSAAHLLHTLPNGPILATVDNGVTILVTIDSFHYSSTSESAAHFLHTLPNGPVLTTVDNGGTILVTVDSFRHSSASDQQHISCTPCRMAPSLQLLTTVVPSL